MKSKIVFCNCCFNSLNYSLLIIQTATVSETRQTATVFSSVIVSMQCPKLANIVGQHREEKQMHSWNTVLFGLMFPESVYFLIKVKKSLPSLKLYKNPTVSGFGSLEFHV